MFYFLTKCVQSRLLQNCLMRERVNIGKFVHTDTCGSDKVQSHNIFLISTSRCDLDLWSTGLGLVCHMSPHYGEHVCQATLESYDAWFLILTFDLHGWDVSRTRYSAIKQYSFWSLIATLTFVVETWVLCETHRLIMVNVCAKFLGNAMTHG